MLIVYTHPNKIGHSGKILEEVISILNKKNTKYELLDLYEMKYDPILHSNEHYTSGNRDVDEVNKEIQEKIKNNDKFIFIYPTWWNNMPAILKGFIDKVFTAGFAFSFEGKMPIKLLKGKAIVFSTTGGPRIISMLFAGDRALKLLVKDTLRFCGIKAKGYSVGSSKEVNNKQILKINKTVNCGIKYLLN
jgi:NAD(P)H dehydrogenase (quinone)